MFEGALLTPSQFPETLVSKENGFCCKPVFGYPLPSIYRFSARQKFWKASFVFVINIVELLEHNLFYNRKHFAATIFKAREQRYLLVQFSRLQIQNYTTYNKKDKNSIRW